MKNLTLCAVSLLVSMQLASAGLLQDIVGTWTLDGTAPGNEITTVFKKSGPKGLKKTSIISVPGLTDAISIVNYKSNGTLRGNVKRDGIVQSTSTGTWRIKGNKLIQKAVLSVPQFSSAKQNTTITLINPNKLQTVSVLNGSRSTGSLSRDR